MKNVVRTILALFILVSFIIAAGCITDSSKSAINIKENFWRNRNSKEIYGESYTNACKNDVDKTELFICRNYGFFGASSFWEHPPYSDKSFGKYMSKGFKENTPTRKVNFFKQAFEHVYDAISYTVSTLCLADAYLQNKDYIDALVLYRLFEKHSRPIIKYHNKEFREALQDEKLVKTWKTWKSQNPHLVKKLESSTKLYKEELK